MAGAGDYSHDRFGREEVHAVRVAGRCGGGAKSQLTVAAVVSFDSTELTSTRTHSLNRIFFASAP